MAEDLATSNDLRVSALEAETAGDADRAARLRALAQAMDEGRVSVVLKS